jgi:hypothetical protein
MEEGISGLLGRHPVLLPTAGVQAAEEACLPSVGLQSRLLPGLRNTALASGRLLWLKCGPGSDQRRRELPYQLTAILLRTFSWMPKHTASA